MNVTTEPLKLTLIINPRYIPKPNKTHTERLFLLYHPIIHLQDVDDELKKPNFGRRPDERVEFPLLTESSSTRSMLSNTLNIRLPTETAVTAPAARGGVDRIKYESFSFWGLAFVHGAFILAMWPRP